MDEQIELPCDRCGKDRRQHVNIIGAGLVCATSCVTFSNSRGARIAALEASRAVMAGRIAELERQRLMILASVYDEMPKFVATICDEELDRSGKLLGEVRALARAALAPKARHE